MHIGNIYLYRDLVHPRIGNRGRKFNFVGNDVIAGRIGSHGSAEGKIPVGFTKFTRNFVRTVPRRAERNRLVGTVTVVVEYDIICRSIFNPTAAIRKGNNLVRTKSIASITYQFIFRRRTSYPVFLSTRATIRTAAGFFHIGIQVNRTDSRGFFGIFYVFAVVVFHHIKFNLLKWERNRIGTLRHGFVGAVHIHTQSQAVVRILVGSGGRYRRIRLIVFNQGRADPRIVSRSAAAGLNAKNEAAVILVGISAGTGRNINGKTGRHIVSRNNKLIKSIIIIPNIRPWIVTFPGFIF